MTKKKKTPAYLMKKQWKADIRRKWGEGIYRDNSKHKRRRALIEDVNMWAELSSPFGYLYTKKGIYSPNNQE